MNASVARSLARPLHFKAPPWRRVIAPTFKLNWRPRCQGSHDLVAASESENGPAKPDPERSSAGDTEMPLCQVGLGPFKLKLFTLEFAFSDLERTSKAEADATLQDLLKLRRR